MVSPPKGAHALSWSELESRANRGWKLTRTGMTILPNMGRRTIWLEDDEQSYGRNGLLAEYVRRQTGKVRNRTQLASHLAVLRKNNPDDTERKSTGPLSASARARLLTRQGPQCTRS